MKEKQRRYEASGAVRAVTRGFHLKCHIVHDADIIVALDAKENKNGYIKDLIRRDISKN